MDIFLMKMHGFATGGLYSCPGAMWGTFYYRCTHFIWRLVDLNVKCLTYWQHLKCKHYICEQQVILSHFKFIECGIHGNNWCSEPVLILGFWGPYAKLCRRPGGGVVEEWMKRICPCYTPPRIALALGARETVSLRGTLSARFIFFSNKRLYNIHLKRFLHRERDSAPH